MHCIIIASLIFIIVTLLCYSCDAGKLHERLVPEDADDVSYTPVEVMKHVKAVMKAAVSEHSAAS